MKPARTILKALSLSFLMGLVFLMTIARAEELPLFYEGIRPLGMGGAFTAVADDENALIYNPAGILHRGSPGDFSLLLPTLETSGNIVDLFKEIKNISKLTDPADQIKRVVDLIGNNIGEDSRLKMSLFPNLLLDRTGVGLLLQTTTELTVHNPLGSNFVRGKGEGDLALLVSHATPHVIKGHPITMGVTVKGVHREVFEKGYTVRELAEKAERAKIRDDFKNRSQGSGGALDIGFLYPLQGRLGSKFLKSVALEPTVGITLQNIIGSDLGDAGDLPFQANAGIALRQKIKAGKLLLAADMVDITRHVGTDTDFGKRLHIGAEYRFPMILSLRTGLYQGYPTLGATIDLWLIHLAYAYYVEEIGAFAGQIPHPRHVLKLSLL